MLTLGRIGAKKGGQWIGLVKPRALGHKANRVELAALCEAPQSSKHSSLQFAMESKTNKLFLLLQFIFSVDDILCSLI